MGSQVSRISRSPGETQVSLTRCKKCGQYRWRLGLAEGEERYAALEAKLAAAPVIAVPTITMEGDANGAPHPEPAAYARKFTGRYEHRLITGGIGHNLPQEAPAAFAQAMLDVARP